MGVPRSLHASESWGGKRTDSTSSRFPIVVCLTQLGRVTVSDHTTV